MWQKIISYILTILLLLIVYMEIHIKDNYPHIDRSTYTTSIIVLVILNSLWILKDIE